MLFRVRVGTTCISASGGNDAAAKGALTNDYPEAVNCAVDSFALHATWFGSQAVRIWPHEHARTVRRAIIEMRYVAAVVDSDP